MTSTLVDGGMLSDCIHIRNADIRSPRIFVDTFVISPVAFDLDAKQRDRLHKSGRAAARKFLDKPWDFDEYKQNFRS